MKEFICTRKHQAIIPGRKRPKWFHEDDTAFFKEPPSQFWQPLEEALETIDLRYASEELLLSGKIELDEIKSAAKKYFGLKLGNRGLQKSVEEFIYARDNMPANQKPVDDEIDSVDLADLE